MTALCRLVVIFFGLILVAGPVHAELEKKLVKSVALSNGVLDVAQSVSDGRLFVLLEGGEVQILTAAGQMQDRFAVGSDITSLAVSPDGQQLYLGAGGAKQLQFVELTYVQELSVDNSAIRGPVDAPVTITVFDDFQCPYCARLVPVLDQVMAIYPERVRLVFKHFPLSMHKFARQAAIAAIAARNQGKFWQLHDKLFANYNKLDAAKIRELAESVGLDMARFDQDIANPALAQEVASDTQQGLKAGVRGTPAAFVNGRPVKERSINGFRALIEQELQKLGK